MGWPFLLSVLRLRGFGLRSLPGGLQGRPVRRTEETAKPITCVVDVNAHGVTPDEPRRRRWGRRVRAYRYCRFIVPCTGQGY